MRVLPALVLVAACGGTTPPAATPIANKPATPAPAIAATCAEAAVILRGSVNSDDKKAGPEKEVAIASTCAKTTWTPEVLSCVASEPDANLCLAKLSTSQHGAYDDVITAWNTTYGEASGEDDPPPPPDDYVDCEDAIGDVENYGVVNVKDPDDHAFAIALRKKGMVDQCNATWDISVRRCLVDAKDPSAHMACAAMLDDGERTDLSNRFDSVNAVMTRIMAARKKPQTIGCKQVVAAHYGDAKWKNVLTAMKPAERKHAIEDSRKQMTAACTSEKWTSTVRACVVVDGGDDCTAQPWRFPAAGILVPTGIAECDAYGAAIVKCTKFPKATRDALLDSFNQIVGMATKATPDLRKAIVDGCTQAMASIEQACAASPP
jgi:hypothetical protein